MNRVQRIQATLEQEFSPVELEIIDQSHLHAGHAGSQPGGETHYKVRIRAHAFKGLMRVNIQRQVMQALQNEFDSGLHALSIDARAP